MSLTDSHHDLPVAPNRLRDMTLPLAALEMALQHRQPPAGLVHHSDRGVQYASESYRRRLAAAGMVPSMSRRGNCYDNALMESFWSSLKRELVHRCQFATRQEAHAAIFSGSKFFTTGSGSTAPSATNPLWTLKPTSTKTYPLPHALTPCPHNQGKASFQLATSGSNIGQGCDHASYEGFSMKVFIFRSSALSGMATTNTAKQQVVTHGTI
jgi:transposase InsO family protein